MNKSLSTVETPILLLNLDKMEQNIKDIANFAKRAGVVVRPHTKTHKSVTIANKQLAAGAVGITVAKVGEAEVMVAGGVTDILIAHPIAVGEKIERLKKLMNQAKIIVAVDSVEQAAILKKHFTKEDPLEVWIKVNSGLNRVGVEPNEEIVELATFINEQKTLHLTGIFTHAGHSYAATSRKKVEEIALEEASAVLKGVQLCEMIGIKIAHRSIGSTPTFQKAGAVKGITEIRPGNAVFYDMVQVGLGVASIDQCALTVVASVVSKKDDRIVIDAGSKTLALDKGAHGNTSVLGHGFVKDHPRLVIEKLSEEHGVIPLDKPTNLRLNDRVIIIPNHACTVVNLFDSYTVHRSGEVIDTWAVDARGRLQ